MRVRIIFAGLFGLSALAGCSYASDWYEISNTSIILKKNSVAFENRSFAFEKGSAAFENKKYKEALSWWHKAAELGHADAQYNLGVIYRNSHPLGQGKSKAIGKLLNNFKVIYSNSSGAVVSDDRKVAWAPLVAELGHAQTQVSRRGRIAQSYILAQSSNVEQNYRVAIRWLSEAARQGHVKAQFNLGVIYFEISVNERDAIVGLGVGYGYFKAYVWFNIASFLRQQSATEALQMVEKLLNDGQIAEAKKEAAKWLEAHKKRQ